MLKPSRKAHCKPSNAMEYLIVYDIAHPRRLQKVHKLLSENAIPLQNSTFHFTGTAGQFEHCWAQLARLIHKHEDDLRAYPLPPQSLKYSIGDKTPEGIYCL